MILVLLSIHCPFILFLTLCYILLYTSLLDSLSSSIQCPSNQHYLKITKKTTSNAKRESFLILSESTLLFSSPAFSDNQQYVFELCLNSSSTHIYTLVMRDTGTGSNLGTWISMSDINDNTIFTGFMKPHTQQDSYQFALYSPIIKNAVWKYSDSYHTLWNANSFNDNQWISITLGSSLSLLPMPNTSGYHSMESLEWLQLKLNSSILMVSLLISMDLKYSETTCLMESFIIPGYR